MLKTEWSEQFAADVYEHVSSRGLYITNIVKWAGLDARLPERQKISLYAPLLREEMKTIRPQLVIAFGQLTFDGLLREAGVKVREPFGAINELMLKTQNVYKIQTELGEVVPCYFPVGQGIKNRVKAVNILRLAAGS